jgi:hypothetical protein
MLRAMRMGLAGILAFTVGCGPSTHETPEGAGAGVDAAPDDDDDGEGSSGDCTEGVDVVLVLDVSSSMGFVLDELEQDIGGVVDASNELAPGAHFGLVAFSDNGALIGGGDLEGGVVHTQAASLISAFAETQATYTDYDRNPGDGPDGPIAQNPICEEDGLDALHLAATDFPWRDDAARVVIMATDDTFLERPDNYGDGNGDGTIGNNEWFEPSEGDYPAQWTVAETTDALTSAAIRVFSFTALEPMSGCGTGRRMNDEDVSDGWSTPYDGAAPFPDATDGRNYDLGAVESGSISLADTIADVVVESHCNPID